MTTPLTVAKKAKKVINSCINLHQLGHAKEYINLFFVKYSTPIKHKTVGIIYEADASTVKLYNNLISTLEKKEKQLKNKTVS